MNHIHLICPGGINLRPTQYPIFEAGYWNVSAKDAKSLLGGLIYLHEIKTAQSYFGGRIKGFRTMEMPHEFAGQTAFLFESLSAARGIEWQVPLPANA
jgi:hypothetical protein